jgi:hypothetical protein
MKPETMLRKLGSVGITLMLTVVPLLGVGWLITVNSEVGMAKEIGIHEPDLAAQDYSAVPQSVIDDATELGTELAGGSKDKLQKFVDQLLAIYLEARDTDIVVFFNSGGWGWNLTEETPGWASILDGIKEQLKGLGYDTLVLNYRRTGGGLPGVFKEFFEAATRYPHRAIDLAKRVEFLTDHLPQIKIIVAGESTGTVITDKTIGLLKDKPRVYSIQTGTPFWHKANPTERTLLMNSNGMGIDTFSYGNVPAMVWATVKHWLRLDSGEENPGDILSWLKAPGHDYSWEYPGVCSEVIRFLEKNFGETQQNSR